MTRVLFLQLPRPEHDPRAAEENIPMAAMYLRASLEKSGLFRMSPQALSTHKILSSRKKHSQSNQPLQHEITCLLPDPAWDQMDNASLVATLDALAPDVIACTLFCWNIERTLRVVRMLQRKRPRMHAIAGGPEVSREHPFLFTQPVFDACVCGEGEGVFPATVAALLEGHAVAYDSVAQKKLLPKQKSARVARTSQREAGIYEWGKAAAPKVSLAQALPSPESCPELPDHNGMAVLETIRGCPMRCTYCRYNQLREGIDILPAKKVLAMMKSFLQHGAREFRFVDPTMNARPDFDALLQGMARLNAGDRFRCFAELNAAALTKKQIHLLAKAGVHDIEIGVQCRAPHVRSAIRRHEDLARAEVNIRHMRAAGIDVSVDLMYGLPEQNEADFQSDFLWTQTLDDVRVQYFQTLLLPGTQLAQRHATWGIEASSKPPYGVQKTRAMSTATMRAIPAWCEEVTGLQMETRTSRFVGKRLRSLFKDRIRVPVTSLLTTLSSGAFRRAVVLEAESFFPHREAIATWIQKIIRAEPDSLWQFVLHMRNEEPLDVLDTCIAAITTTPRHVLDRTAQTQLRNRFAARKLFVELDTRGTFSPDWIDAAEETLAAVFL